MPSLYIRNLPEPVYERLKKRAKSDRRSLQQEAAWLLEKTLETSGFGGLARLQQEMSRLYGILSDSTPIIRRMRDER